VKKLNPDSNPGPGQGLGSNPELHTSSCSCWRCIADVRGRWLDVLSLRTCVGTWILFVTLTYRTPAYPWKRGFPGSGAGKPNPEFAEESTTFAFYSLRILTERPQV